MGLREFLIILRDRCVTGAWLNYLPSSWWIGPSRVEEGRRAAEKVADTVLLLIDGGNFNLARTLFSIFQDHAYLTDEERNDVPLEYEDYPGMFYHLNLPMSRDLFVLAKYPPWNDFADGCDLADRIESFLAALNGDKTLRALTEACHRDLTTLLVLADWCDEHNLPMAAAEARHLHRLIQNYL